MMKDKTWKLLPSDCRHLLLFLLLALLISACRDDPQISDTTSTEIGTPQSNTMPGAVLTEMPKLPARRGANNPLPQVLELDMVKASNESTSLQMPALIEATVAGRNINSISIVAGRHEQNGGKRLVTYEPIVPATTEQDWPIQWPDGIHDLSYVWYTDGDHLSDGITGDFVLLWQIDPDSNVRSTNGRFRRSGTSTYTDSVLIVDIFTGLASELLDTNTGEVIVAEPGDQFQITDLLLDETGATITAPGVNLTFGESAQLNYERKSLPQGNYFLGFITEGGSGNADSLYANYTVSNENLLPDLRAYLQPEYGFQFLYPFQWSEFSVSGQGVVATDDTETVLLQIAVDESSDQDNPSVVKHDLLSSLGEIQILYEDQVQIGSLGGLRTVYGYESPTGPRTGVVLIFGHDGRQYIVDVDGPSAEEAILLNVMETVIDSWIWRPVAEDNQVTEWKGYDIDGYQVDIPSDLRYNLLSNGWYRFSDSDGDSFLAIRIEPRAGQNLANQQAHWLEIAGRNIDSFVNSDIYEFQLSGIGWLRVDFQYNDDESGEIWGAIMAAEAGEDHLVAWFEAPKADFFHWEENPVTLSLADLLNK